MLKLDTPMTMDEAAGTAVPDGDVVSLVTTDPDELAQAARRRLRARRSRVARIRRQVEAGTYEIDGGRVAEAIIGRLQAVGRMPTS
jgi:anti-sigma28 factor (negative regulator of flagellin synthesis)